MIQVAARSNTWGSDRSLAGIVNSSLAGGMDVFLVTVACCQVEVSDREASIIRRPWVTRGCYGIKQ